jgi:predicted nucleic acid-binding protein
MILVDTSVWVDHLRKGLPALIDLLNHEQVLAHSFVTGELALGSLKNRAEVLNALADLPQARVATDDEVLQFIDQHKLYGLGVGYVDAHLLAAVKLTSGTKLWTADRRLASAAEKLGMTQVR